MWTKGAAVFPASKKSGLQGATQTCAFPHFPGLTHAFMANGCSSWRGQREECRVEQRRSGWETRLSLPVSSLGNPKRFWAKLAETRLPSVS